MKANVDFRKCLGRKTIKTLNQAEEYITGTDLVSLNAKGLQDLHTYVSSGFTTIPKILKFRTDRSQLAAET